MGITTTFKGRFVLDRPLAPEHVAYLRKFSETRRIKRSVERLATIPDPVREAVGLPVGPEGAYFVGDELSGIDASEPTAWSRPPEGQPGLYCDWVPTPDGRGIVWNGADKFYNYVEWIGYLIKHFLKPSEYSVSGSVRWESDEAVCWSEEEEDLVSCIERGEIVVINNIVHEQNRETVLL